MNNFARHWLAIIIMWFTAIACYKILDGNLPYIPRDDLRFYYYWASPFILIIVALKAWYQLFKWRRMRVVGSNPMSLARGEGHQIQEIKQPGLLEDGCLVLMLIALATIFKLLSIPHFWWWANSLMISLVMLKFIFKRLG